MKVEQEKNPAILSAETADELSGCPKCGGAQFCPCKACANTGKVVWKQIEGVAIACGHCGHTMSADSWEELEMERAYAATVRKRA